MNLRPTTFQFTPYAQSTKKIRLPNCSMQPTSSGVARTGCIWDSKPVNYSEDTKTLLREFMKESKLTFAQQRKLKDTVAKTGMLPPPPQPGPKKVRRAVTTVPKVLNPKNYSGGVRTRNQILSSGDLSRPSYRPPVGGPERTEDDKERLAHIMAFGVDSYNEARFRKMHRPSMENGPDDDDDDHEVDRFDELCAEIEDRREFLATMSKVGQDKKYRSLIETEISQKLREMEVIDKKRSAMLYEAAKK